MDYNQTQVSVIHLPVWTQFTLVKYCNIIIIRFYKPNLYLELVLFM